MDTKSKVKRCYNCNKKIKLMEYNCRCENIFCVKCRMPEDHNCTFDHKNFGKLDLENKLEKVVGQKLIKL